MMRRLLALLLLLPALALGATNNYNIGDSTNITGGVFSDPTLSGTITLPGLNASSLVLTNGSRALTSFAGVACTNQFVRSLSTAGAATCSSVLNADLAGSIAASKLIGTDISTLGAITTGTWHGTVIAGQYGGTGIANTGKTITLGGNLVTTGGFATTFTTTATTNVTLPTTGTLSTLAGAESLTNKKLGSLTSDGLVTTSSGNGTLGVTVPGTGVLTALASATNASGGFVTYSSSDLGSPSALDITTTGADTFNARTAAYRWTAWSPSDCAGTSTNAPNTSAATVTATNYMTMANTAGTVTFTFTKAGNYLINFLSSMSAAANYTDARLTVTAGGSATRITGVTDFRNSGVPNNSFSNGGSFLVTATASQTLTLLPKVELTQGACTVGNYSALANATATYVGQ